jgi:hypothetical protein
MPAREDELGGLWSREGRNGEFLSGKLTLPDGSEVEVVVFRNTHKQPGERTPDWRVYRSQPREGQPAQQPQRQEQRGYAQRREPPQPSGGGRRNYGAELDDDLPFSPEVR